MSQKDFFLRYGFLNDVLKTSLVRYGCFKDALKTSFVRYGCLNDDGSKSSLKISSIQKPFKKRIVWRVFEISFIETEDFTCLLSTKDEESR